MLFLGMKKNLMKIYEVDASGLTGNAADVVFPTSVQEVRKIVQNSKRVSIRGAGTGLVGGAVPQNGMDIVLDLSKMIRIDNLDKERLTVEVDAGVILDDLQAYLSGFGLEFPVNPSSHSVATIGGMIATDAVGSRGVKYGKTSNWVKWVEVVDGYGNVDRKGITELSDYAGMEGITGVIVKACLKLSERKKRTASLIGVDDVDKAVAYARDLKRNSEVSMIEFMDRQISVSLGLEDRYHLIVEYEGDSGKMKGEEYRKLLALRDSVGPKMSEAGNVILEDPKILLDKSAALIKWFESKGIPVFGHFGYGILHPRFNEETKKYIPDMMKFVKRLGGQVSGEHGIGLLKKEFVEINDRKILENVKKRTDPQGKFNMGKVL